MVITDNILALRKMFCGYTNWQRLRSISENLESSPVKLQIAKNGSPTLTFQRGDATQVFIHSAYDPEQEAKSFVQNMDEDEVAKFPHVFFYGVGLGYLVDAFLKRFPKKFFTLYEPSPEAFCHFLSVRKIDSLPLRQSKFLYIEYDPHETEQNASHFLYTNYEEVMFVTLPSYERAFPEAFKRFSEKFVTAIKTTLSNRATAMHFEKRWTINSIVNFGENLKNPCIFNCNKEYFRNKPAILAAAGPSLAPELENLRKIKQDGSAYIFTVGSAIKYFVNNNLMPDAAVSMDPGGANIGVFEEVIEQGLPVPIIYGTSVGHETLTWYPGPKLFMVMDKDHITPYYMPQKSKEVLPMVGDAPTIAITTLQMMILVGFNPIILVGQNLAFLNDAYWAEGIKYSYRDHKVQAYELDGATTEDTYGNQVVTNHGWIYARKIMESFILGAPGTRVLNATKGGAKIEGAPFQPLEEIMEQEMTCKVVVDDWYKQDSNPFDIDHIKKKDDEMQASMNDLFKLFDASIKVLLRINEYKKYKKEKQLNIEFMAFDRVFSRIPKNLFFKTFVSPMLMIENQIVGNNMRNARAKTTAAARSDDVVDEFTRYINEARNDMGAFSVPLYKRISQQIAEFIKEREEVDSDEIEVEAEKA
jgi:hypothetical protein